MLDRAHGPATPFTPDARGALAADGLFHRLLDALPAGAYTCDPDGLITYFNAHAVELWGRAPRLNDPGDRYCGSFRLHATDGAPIPHDRCWMALALATRERYNARPIVIERPDGDRRAVLAHANPVHDDDGRLLGAVNVLVDVSDRARAEDALREADRAKSEFLATMSHEIRTPINAIVGYADLLDAEVAGALGEGQRAYVGRIRAASGHLLALVTEVLDLAKAQTGRLHVRHEPRPVAAVLEAALAVAQPLAAARSITIVAADAPPWLAYLGDEDRVRQMLVNLLSNAVKFSQPGGHIEVAALAPDPAGGGHAGDPDGRSVRLAVRDFGVGIAPEEIERIFEPFVQVEGTWTRTRGGTGLGLTITRRLARLMGGDIVVESAHGAGSTFTIRLPAARAAGDGPGAHAAVTDASPAGRPPFAATSRAILVGLDAVVHRFVERLRAEGIGPGAGTLPVPRLASHVATLLADAAVAMLEAEDAADGHGGAAGDPSGSAVQRACALEHGRRRARLGWRERDVAREYDVLWEEVVACLDDAGPGAGAGAATVREALRRHLDAARASSVEGVRAAGGATAPIS